MPSSVFQNSSSGKAIWPSNYHTILKLTLELSKHLVWPSSFNLQLNIAPLASRACKMSNLPLLIPLAIDRWRCLCVHHLSRPHPLGLTLSLCSSPPPSLGQQFPLPRRPAVRRARLASEYACPRSRVAPPPREEVCLHLEKGAHCYRPQARTLATMKKRDRGWGREGDHHMWTRGPTGGTNSVSGQP
jgi:hypothetical protein